MATKIQILQNALNATDDVVTNVAPAQWKDRNPNPGWSNQDALNHLTGALALVANAVDPAKPAAVIREDVTVQEYQDAAAAALAAVQKPGALEGDVKIPWATYTGDGALSMLIMEVLLHGWDIAQGTDQQVAWDDETAQVALDLANARPEGGDGQPFGAPVAVPTDAPITDRVVARTGRNPHPGA